MGDNVSNVSSNWARDEFEFVDEIRMEKHPPAKGPYDFQNEDPVSAALSLVVDSARHGVITLCASVAHLLRDKSKLQQQVANLEKQVIALESSSSGSESLSCSCSRHCHSSNVNGVQESLIPHQCGSAPENFITSGLKLLKTECQNNVISAKDSNLRYYVEKGECRDMSKSRIKECRASSVSMPEAQSSLLPRVFSNDRKSNFARGGRQASTRSLNICQSFPASSFVRRKYSTISLRRVRRSTANRQKASSLCSTSSISSSHSCTNSEDQRRNSNNSSCIITVAEIHMPPDQEVKNENREGEAVKLLARTLTNVLQSDSSNNSVSCSGSTGTDDSLCSEVSKSSSGQEFCLPHPLAGCECTICARLAADPGCQLFALTAEGGTLLPVGSHVLVEGERVGTVLYLGHEKFPAKHQSYTYSCSPPSLLSQEPYTRPVGVTIKLWGPEYGEIFVPLSGVICQLDDFDLPRKESWSSLEYEYLDEDSDEEHLKSETELVSDGSPSTYNDILADKNLIVPKVQITQADEWRPPYDNCFIKSPSVSSCSSIASHSIGDLSLYGLEYGEDGVELGRDCLAFSDSEETTAHETSTLHDVETTFDTSETRCPGSELLNTTFVSSKNADNKKSKSDFYQDFTGSLYDTCDSAISLSFTKRLQYSEDNSGPSSLTDTGTESSQFGDTWDSGCSVGRVRCRSDSSGHCSDMESENITTKSLGDALNFILKKHNIQRELPSEKHVIENEKRDTCYHKTKKSQMQWITAREDTSEDFGCSSDRYNIQENFPGQSEV